jgi:hypothetical protein
VSSLPSNAPRAYHDPRTGLVVIDYPSIYAEVLRIKLWSKEDSLIDKYLISSLGASSVFQETIKLSSRCLDKLYPETSDLYDLMMCRTLNEEMRHAVDTIWMGRRSNSDVPYQRMGDVLLAAEGRLRRLVWEPAQAEDGMVFVRGFPIRVGNALSELSGQMTAAAMSDPTLVLLEWWDKLAQISRAPSDPQNSALILRQSPSHILAAILGTLLLGERLDSGPPLSWPMFGEPDFTALADCAAKLARRPPRELRLALKAIYQDEFTHAIDEPPFAEITSEGDLRDRRMATG